MKRKMVFLIVCILGYTNVLWAQWGNTNRILQQQEQLLQHAFDDLWGSNNDNNRMNTHESDGHEDVIIVPMKSLEVIKMPNVNTGQLIDFEVSSDVVVDGIVVIPRGSKGCGEVIDVQKSKGYSPYTESFSFKIVSVSLPSGEILPLNSKVSVASGTTRIESFNKKRAKIPKDFEVRGTISRNLLMSKISTDLAKAVPQKRTQVAQPNSDVDVSIPEGNGLSENTFAVIIANENYSSESQVDYAINDGRAFKEYCRKTLGLPDLNIHYSENATMNNIIKEIDWLSKVAEAFGSDAKLIIYYAGHGIPDEKTNSAYLLPVDGVGTNVKTGYSLDALYEQLASLPASSVTVFMDACFSGTKRGEGMLANARGVAIKAKPSEVKGKLIVFTAAQGDETAYPYKEKGHGLFTYFLLKKIQDTKGNCSLLELGDYLKTQVFRRSIVVNGKSQTPTVKASPKLGDTWQNIRLK